MTKNQIDYWKNQIEQDKLELTSELQQSTIPKLIADTEEVRSRTYWSNNLSYLQFDKGVWDRDWRKFDQTIKVINAIPIVGAAYKLSTSNPLQAGGLASIFKK